MISGSTSAMYSVRAVSFGRRLVLAVGVKEHVEAHGRPQPHLGTVGRRDRAGHAGQEIVERPVEDREEDLLLGPEVVVEAAC
jgi:hypothetical protein